MLQKKGNFETLVLFVECQKFVSALSGRIMTLAKKTAPQGLKSQPTLFLKAQLILRKKEKKILKGSHKAAPMKSHINTPEHFEQGVQENVNYRSYYSSLRFT